MENVILLDSEHYEDDQIGLYDSVTDNIQDIEHIEMVEEVEEENINEREQVYKSDNIIFNSDDIDNNISIKAISIEDYELEGYESSVIYNNDSGFSSSSDFTCDYNFIDYDLLGFYCGYNGGYENVIVTKDQFVRSSNNSSYPKPFVCASIRDSNLSYYSGYFNSVNDLNIIHMRSSGIRLYKVIGYKYKEVVPVPEPTPEQTTSSNTIINNNYYCSVSDDSLSLNLINKKLNNYSVSESLLLCLLMGLFVAGFSWFIKKNIFKL